MDQTEKVSEHWGKPRSKIGERNHWLNHPLTRAHINIRATGSHTKDVLTWWREDIIDEQLDNVLSIGCGFGVFERSLVRLGLARNILGIDLSADAIEAAIASAKEEGMSDRIEYKIADLNEFVLESGKYDAIFAVSAVHHIEKLEEFFFSCRHALKPSGRLFLDEYIGPSRFQLSDAALDAINSIFAIMPERYRMMMELEPVELRDRMYRPTLEWFEKNDPSESVRSADIMSTLKAQFDVVDFRPYGGAIAHLLFSGIAANFDETNEDHRTIMLLVLLIEQLLEKHQIIETDFAALVARPKAAL